MHRLDPLDPLGLSMHPKSQARAAWPSLAGDLLVRFTGKSHSVGDAGFLIPRGLRNPKVRPFEVGARDPRKSLLKNDPAED